MSSIFNIQSFSTTDGPGIRTVVFFQGCNMTCLWCHNPESQMLTAPDVFFEEKCIRCEACNFANAGECYAQARVKSTREFTTQGLMGLIKNDMPYLKNSGGGVTFSGGECMLQVDFLTEMVELCKKENLHTAVDTAGHVPYEWLTRVNPDMFLYDIKALSPKLHKELTGVDGLLVWENLKNLIKDRYNVEVRIPCVPGANWDELPTMFENLQKIGVTNIELLPYHRLGEGKGAWLNKKLQTFTPPTEKEMEDLWSKLNFLQK